MTPSTETDWQEQQALTDALGYTPPSYIGPNGDTVTPTIYASAGVEPGPVTGPEQPTTIGSPLPPSSHGGVRWYRDPDTGEIYFSADLERPKDG